MEYDIVKTGTSVERFEIICYIRIEDGRILEDEAAY
jgi:hypothetical protein